MNRRAGAFCIPLLLIFALAFQNLTVVRGVTGEETEYYVKSTVTYSNKGDKVWNFTEREEDRTIGLFMNNSWQTAYLVNSTRTVETRKSDEDGNNVAVLRFSKMALGPGDNTTYAVTYRVVSKPRNLDDISEADAKDLTQIPKSLEEKYLGAEGPWLVNDTNLQSLAHSVAGNESNVLAIIKCFVEWIAENVDYEVHETPQYPNETFASQRGDCDDQAILLITLSRIVGIPAFLQIGAIFLPHLSQTNESHWEDSHGRPHVTVVQRRIGWHGWAMVYIPPWGWLPVDLTYIFGGLSGDPLNAIRNAAVTSKGTIQFMNISKFDYVGSSRKAKNFIITNEFYLNMEDEMIETIGERNPFGEGLEALFPIVLVAMVALLLTSSYFIAKRLNRKEEIPTPLTRRKEH